MHTSDPAFSSWITRFGHSIPMQCGLLVLFVLVIVGHPVPEPVTEYLYLPCLANQYNPQWIANDWTMASTWYEHAVFNLSFGWLTLFLPLEVVGWLGRLTVWLLLLSLLYQVGKHLALPAWMTSLAIVFWLLREQSIVASEWVFGGFEAKVVSYVFLFASLVLFFKRRETWGAFCLGICFSFHAAVGLWAGLAVGFALVMLRMPIRQLIPLAGWVILGALPGLVFTVLLLQQGGTNSVEAWKFVVLVQAPQHFDPWSWPLRERLLVFVLLGFNIIHAVRRWEQRPLRFLLFFQLALALFFVLGLWWRWQESYYLLRYFPFRLFPVFVLLSFLLQVMMVLHEQIQHANPPQNLPISEDTHPQRVLSRLAIFLGLVGLMSLGNPVAQFVDFLNQTRQLWRPKQDDLHRTLRWVRDHIPTGQIVIQPPWVGETFYVTRRAQIANWWANRYDKLPEWMERLEAMLGKIPPLAVTKKQDLLQKKQDLLETNYNSRTPEQIRAIVKKYGGHALVSKANYTYPVLFKTPTYRVYDLRSLAR